MTNKNMTFVDYAETQGWILDSMRHMHDEGGLDVDQLFDSICDEAQRDGIQLSDLSTCNFLDFINDLYTEIDFRSN